MARAKSISNKPKNEKLTEFNYEQEAEQSYAAAANPTPPETHSVLSSRVEFNYNESASAQTQNKVIDTNSGVTTNLFLINGRVRMERAGSKHIEADQQRIVYASNFTEAVTKYNTYFSSLSSPGERYSVISAGGSESIR